jgi:hypothetical protein
MVSCLSMIAVAMLPLLSCSRHCPALPILSGTHCKRQFTSSHGGAALQGDHMGHQQRHVYSSGQEWRSQAPQRKSG